MLRSIFNTHFFMKEERPVKSVSFAVPCKHIFSVSIAFKFRQPDNRHTQVQAFPTVSSLSTAYFS